MIYGFLTGKINLEKNCISLSNHKCKQKSFKKLSFVCYLTIFSAYKGFVPIASHQLLKND